METIDYLGAPVRHWVIVVSVAVFVAIVAVLIPVHSSASYPFPEWQANTVVGLTPQGGGLNALGARLDLQQVAYYAQQPAVLNAAARSVGLSANSALANDLVVTKVTGKAKEAAGPNKLEIGIVQPTKSGSAHLTRAFATALVQYVNGRIAAKYQTQLNQDQTRVNDLASAIANLRGTTPFSSTTTSTTTPGSVTATTAPTTATSTTTTTTSPRSTTTTTKPSTTTTTKASTTTTTKASTTTTTKAGDPPATTASSTTTTTTVPTTTTTTTKTIAERPIRKHALLDLADFYAAALNKLETLKANGVPPSGVAVLRPAKASSAVLVPGGPSLFDHRWFRLFLGLLIGAIVGILTTYLVEAFDRRLRSEARAAEVFGLPVIVKVPGIPPALRPSKEPPTPVVDVVVAPESQTAEAYRKLHVAIRTTPLVSWVRRYGPMLGVSSGAELYAPPVRPAEPAAANEAADATTSAGASGIEVVGNGGLVDRVPVGRRAILVASPRFEPTRSLAVANLAAVFAEAGQRVLVVTMGGLRTRLVVDGHSILTMSDLGPDPDPELIIASARPSQLPGVSSLPLGQILENPSRLLAKADALVRAAREVVDVVLFEASLLSTQDAEALLPFVDVVVVVAEFWYTTVGDGRETRRLLSRHRAPVLGLALTNEVPAGLAGLGLGPASQHGQPTGTEARRVTGWREPVGAQGPTRS